MHAICLVSGDHRLRHELHEALRSQGVWVSVFDSGGSYLASPASAETACLILDTDLPDMSAHDLQQQVADSCAAVLFVTRCEDIALAVRAMTAGALDYLTWPVEPCSLMRTVRAGVELASMNKAQRYEASALGERFARLTLREQQVLRSVISGLLNKQVAAELGISDVTVRAHRRRVMHRMGAVTFADLVRIAASLGIPPVRRLQLPRQVFDDAAYGRRVHAPACHPPPSARNTLT